MNTVVDSTLDSKAEFARKFNLSLEEYLKLSKVCNTNELTTVLELMRVKNHKSSYRQRMHLQVRRWLDNSPSLKPLLPRQFELLAPTWPLNWQFPR